MKGLDVPSAQYDFSDLFRQHYSSVYRYVYFRVREEAVAEDLTSEVFERAYRALESYDPVRGAFSTWIGRIAHNHVANYFVKQQQRTQHEIDGPELETLAASDALPEVQVILGEAVQRLLECLERLAERDRQVIALRFGINTRNKEIAELLGLKEHSVSVIILRTLERLRGCQEGFSL